MMLTVAIDVHLKRGDAWTRVGCPDFGRSVLGGIEADFAIELIEGLSSSFFNKSHDLHIAAPLQTQSLQFVELCSQHLAKCR